MSTPDYIDPTLGLWIAALAIAAWIGMLAHDHWGSNAQTNRLRPAGGGDDAGTHRMHAGPRDHRGLRGLLPGAGQARRVPARGVHHDHEHHAPRGLRPYVRRLAQALRPHRWEGERVRFCTVHDRCENHPRKYNEHGVRLCMSPACDLYHGHLTPHYNIRSDSTWGR